MSGFVRPGLTAAAVARGASGHGASDARTGGPRQARGPGREPSLRWQLVLLVGAVGLALVLLAGLAVWRGHDHARRFHQHVLLDDARAVIGLVDREFATGTALLRGLAASTRLAAGDYDGFDAQARAAEPPGTWIVAFDHDLRHVVNTVVPRPAFASVVGERLPAPELVGLVRDVFATGHVRISDVFEGLASKRKLVAVLAPAPGADGAVGHVIMLAIPVDRIAALLADHHWPVFMQAAVRDGAGRTLGGPAGGQSSGGPSAGGPGLAVPAWSGVADEVLTVPPPPGGDAGRATVVAFAGSPDSAYVGVVSVPEARFDASAGEAVLETAVTGGLIALCGCLAAAALAHRLAAALRTLATPGGPASMASRGARRGPREVADLARDLAAATAERDRATAELRALFDTSPIALVRADASGRILDANDAFRRLLGLTDADLADGRLAWDAITPCAWHGIDAAAIAEAVATGRCQPYEKEFLRADLQRVPALVSFARLDAATGQVGGFLVDLTDRHAAESALRETGTRLRAIFDWAFEFIFLLTPDGTLIEANRAALDFAGIDRAGAVGRPFWQTIWWPRAPTAQARLRAAIAEAAAGGFARYEASFQGAGGRVATVDFSLRPVRDESGAVVLLIPEARDITEWRSVQAALAASERRLALAQEVAGLGTWAWTIASDEKTWSEQQCRIYGVDPAAPAPRFEAWLSLIVPQDRDRARAVLMEAVATRGDYRTEFSIRRVSDGAIRRIFAAGRGERDDDGRVRSMVGVNLDITEERVTRAALRSAETRLLLAQETAGIGFFDRDVATGAIAVTPAWLAICGLPPEAGLGLVFGDWLALLHPADRDRIEATNAAMLQAGASFESEFRILRADTGEVRWLETRGCRIEPGPGDGPRVIGVTRDITATKAAAALLTDANARLEARVAERTRALTDAARALSAEIRRGEAARVALLQAQKLGAIGELTSGVVHDFNNVLTAIGGSFEMLERRIVDPASARILGQGQRAIARAAGLSRQLLAFARKAEALRPAIIDPARMLRDAGEFLRQAAGPTVACAIDATDDVWPVLVDPDQLEVALLNLVVNARDAMPDGGTITVSVRNGSFDAAHPAGSPGADTVVLTVRDTGAGMSGEVLARAAEPFFTTKAAGSGTGLGLAMVQEFAARVGGGLRIESRVGVGTAVSIVLPRAHGVVMLASQRPAGVAARPDDGAADDGAVILLVEANEPVRMATAAFLRETGYTVIDAAEAETGFVLVSALDRLDLVLADTEPPEGAALAARIRADRPGTPILSMTACAGAASAGSAIGLTRPFAHADLAVAVATLLGRARTAAGDAGAPPRPPMAGIAG